MATKVTKTFTKTFKMELEVLDKKELEKVMGDWSEKEKHISVLAEKNKAKILTAFGKEGARKCHLEMEDGEIKKYWYYTKWGWSEA